MWNIKMHKKKDKREFSPPAILKQQYWVIKIMMRRKPREEPEKHDRWLVSYADFITLLFAFFVVMYSISSVNEGKYRVLSDTLVAAFNNPPKSDRPINLGQQFTAPGVILDASPSVVQLKRKPTSSANRMQKIAQRVSRSLQPLIDKKLIRVTRDKHWVKVEINSKILYPSGSAELEEEAIPILRNLAKVLKTLSNQVDVEGHTDNIPINNEIYPSNWELSAARAARVVRVFANAGLRPERLAAIGFGEYRYIVKNTTARGRHRNRRVVVVILADKNTRHKQEIGQQNAQIRTQVTTAKTVADKGLETAQWKFGL